MLLQSGGGKVEEDVSEGRDIRWGIAGGELETLAQANQLGGIGPGVKGDWSGLMNGGGHAAGDRAPQGSERDEASGDGRLRSGRFEIRRGVGREVGCGQDVLFANATGAAGAADAGPVDAEFGGFTEGARTDGRRA